MEVCKAFLSGWDQIRRPEAILPCANYYNDATIDMVRQAASTGSGSRGAWASPTSRRPSSGGSSLRSSRSAARRASACRPTSR